MLPESTAFLVVVLTYWSVDIVSPALPAIKEALALSATGAGLVFSLMFVGRLLGNMPATMLLERRGAAMTALAGATILAFGSALASVAPGILVLLVARFLQGAGISLTINASLRSLLSARPTQGAAMTRLGIAATIGGVLGLQIGGWLTDAPGWRSIFVLSAMLGVVMAAVAAGSAKRAARVAAVEQPVDEHPRPRAATADLAGPIALNFFAFAHYSLWVILPLYAERRFEASSNATANLLMIITVVHLIAAVPVGRMIARYGSEWVYGVGVFIGLGGSASILVAPSLGWMSIPLVLYGVGQVAAVNAGGDVVLQRDGGSNRAIGLVRLSSDAGLVIGPIVAGAIADLLGYSAPFVALPAMMAVAGALAFWQASRRLAFDGDRQ
jgi:MFS transporter, DHA1 family, multidrug resistance protein